MSPASVAQCHGARTRLGPRGGGRLHVLSTDAVTPPSIVCSTGASGRCYEPMPGSIMRSGGPTTAAPRRGGGTHLPARTIASDATYSVARNASEDVRSAWLV